MNMSSALQFILLNPIFVKQWKFNINPKFYVMEINIDVKVLMAEYCWSENMKSANLWLLDVFSLLKQTFTLAKL